MPETLGPYQLEEEIGRGGMGVVYRAVDTRLGRKVAIKLLPGDNTADPERRRRLVREAQSASTLNHPNIVTIYEIGQDAERTFIAMELVEGEPLSQIIARGAVAPALALDYAAQAASGLAAAHTAGLIHRDIKPANLVVTTDGRVKILDFGLAKLAELAPSDATVTQATEAGIVMGTAAYMSPEQVEGRILDARSDIFSLGVVLYEMLGGRRPFTGPTNAAVMAAILRDTPERIAGAGGAAARVAERAMARQPAGRYPSADDMRRDLVAARDGLTRPAAPLWRRPAVVAPALLMLVAVLGFAIWQNARTREASRVRRDVIPEIERLQFSERPLSAWRLARDVARTAPDDVRRVTEGWFPFDTTSAPAGATIEIRDYGDTSGTWERLGTTPISGVRLPFALYRMRVKKEGYAPVDLNYSAGKPPIRLVPAAEARPGMVRVDGGPFQVGITAPVRLPDFWIDRVEVTNREFKAFVDAGGYRDPKYWTHPFVEGARTLTFDEAAARFKDATGRPGPSTWVVGSYPDGQADHPVGGISWYEAAAYATFAGKALPSVYHWYRAAGADDVFSDILRMSNVDAAAPARAGEREGVSPWGTFDMAGNVKEWCANAVANQPLRYTLGGGWNEPGYRFRESDARDPWARDPALGLRLIADVTPGDPALAHEVATLYGDPASLVPASDEVFRAYTRFYDYDRSPLDAKVEAVDDSSPHWRREKVSYRAAYGDERIPAFVFLPKNAKPPYQTVLLFPTSYARETASSEHLDYATFDFIIRSGRALIYPVYQDTFERGIPAPAGTAAVRDLNVQWAKDVMRSMDYLVTRPDVDRERIGYFSVSLGAFFGPIPLALDTRFRAAVFAAGGLRFRSGGQPVAPEIQTAHFMPRIKAPVLIINGRDDFSVPEPAQRRFYELVGSPPGQKKVVRVEGGHVPADMLGFFREVLGWFDRWLGEVK